MHSVTTENERDYELIATIQRKLIFDKITLSKSTGEILHGLMQELNQLKAELTGKRRSAREQPFDRPRCRTCPRSSLAASMLFAREMTRPGGLGVGKKRIILSRTPRRKKRDDMPLVRLSSFGLFSLHGLSSALVFTQSMFAVLAHERT